jgi:hypothetical protein
MYRMWKELHGNNNTDDICWFVDSPTMNPRLPLPVVERAIAKNPAKARSEYLNIWREDQSDFLPDAVVEACTDWDVYERASEPGVIYFAFVDAAGGTGRDSYGLCICHVDADGCVVVDVNLSFQPQQLGWAKTF